MFNALLKEVLLLEGSVSEIEIAKAIENRQRVIINYESEHRAIDRGPRVCEIYAMGLSKSGNPIIRVFQPNGSTVSKVPHWKTFLISNIVGWKPLNYYFNRPPETRYKVASFNKDGDESMSVVKKNVVFSDKLTKEPEEKESKELFKTYGDKSLELLKRNLETIKNLKKVNSEEFNDIESKNLSGPKKI